MNGSDNPIPRYCWVCSRQDGWSLSFKDRHVCSECRRNSLHIIANLQRDVKHCRRQIEILRRKLKTSPRPPKPRKPRHLFSRFFKSLGL